MLVQSKCPNIEAGGKTIEIRGVQKCAVALKLKLNSCQSAILTENTDLNSPLRHLKDSLRFAMFCVRYYPFGSNQR